MNGITPSQTQNNISLVTKRNFTAGAHWRTQLAAKLMSPIMAVLLAAAMSLATNYAYCDEEDESALSEETNGPSNKPPVAPQGEKFFLLSDSGFASNEEARVRIEAAQQSAISSYGGVDVRLYRIPKPLEFLQKQKNLHRLQTDVNYKGDGIANSLTYLWDSWYKNSRRLMQNVFSADTRSVVINTTPQLKMGSALNQSPKYTYQAQFAPLPNLPLITEFRYPLADAATITPPANVKLDGSSSDFIAPTAGNVYIPLGKREPGLYLVEAFVHNVRATTLVFVADTLGITKISGQQLTVWAANKTTGKAVSSAKILWTDGLGVLASGATNSEGLVQLKHSSAERTYVLGEDDKGGVFIAENFYYDSEIYNTKLYAFTDRPLYRPGDSVSFKILGREFKTAKDQQPAKSAPITLTVIDAAGTTLQTIKTQFDSVQGAQGQFLLPANAVAGGYELQFTYDNQIYTSAFRVADYVKPHFEINLQMAKTEFHTGDAVTGKVQLLYPDGKPVANAHIDLTLRSQQLTMVDAQLQYSGQFPVSLTSESLTTDAQGLAELNLPASDKPSRYVLTLFASDGAAFRVKTTKEILIERSTSAYRLTASRNFTAPGEKFTFTFVPINNAPASPPVRYEWIRLEDQTRGEGTLPTSGDSFTLPFEKSGNYSIHLRDANQLLVAGTSLSVTGPEQKTTPGSVDILFDRASYAIGDTATALITFPEAVDEALLTLERDGVEQTALLSKGGDWVKITKLNANQYQASIAVKTDFAPNITFSVVYSLHEDFSFQNAGIKVNKPMVAIAVTADKTEYLPGQTVNLDIKTHFLDKPIAAQIVLSVVDEMIYTLQPEIAPSIEDFFYHPRRNNVRTSASLAFINYDLALPGTRQSLPGQRQERGVKLLERPRRDDKDTASWQPSIQTDNNGLAHVSFTLPDALTRWRITARAMTPAGEVGQATSFIRSEKPAYLKWSGPTQFREQDQPKLGLLAFNQGKDPIAAQLNLALGTQTASIPAELKPGVSYLALPESFKVAAGDLTASLSLGDQTLDALSVGLNLTSAAWPQARTEKLRLEGISTPLALPADARQINLKTQTDAASLFMGVANDLVEYPYGCVEQTASRLLPLSIAYSQIPAADKEVRDRLQQIMQFSRLRLVQMAGPEALFSWWGGADSDAFLTAYAYYADYYASSTQGISLPPEHWQRVLDVYASKAKEAGLLKRALIIDFAARMQLPIPTLVKGLLEDLDKASQPTQDSPTDNNSSLIMGAADSPLGLAAARVIADRLSKSANVPTSPAHAQALAQALETLQQSPTNIAKAIALYRQPYNAAAAQSLLLNLAPEHATLERALILSWLAEAAAQSPKAPQISLEGAWRAQKNRTLSEAWRWTGTGVPTAIDLKSAPAEPVPALVHYTSAEAPAQADSTLSIERHLVQLMPGDKALNFATQAVSGTEVTTNTLYLDEIVVKYTGKKPLHYALLEVPLPPGADVERTTWGIEITFAGTTDAVVLEKAQNEDGQLSYAVPLEQVVGEIRLRHLVRFGQKGVFQLPAARLKDMYNPARTYYEQAPHYSRLQVN
ncbi:MAG TPA: alpha-2-macroglobulin [Cellvibrionaceae bacterium]